MLEWHERYEVGVESIDNAHKEIFRVINRLQNMIRIGGNTKWTAAEAVKYLRTYALKHFQDEEEYMRAIEFRDYEIHKSIHDGMRDKIIPRLYSRMESEDYSDASISQFLSVCEKWLNTHIIGHDRELLKYHEDERPEDGKNGA